MPGWSPGPDPFPGGAVRRITHFSYRDELKLVRHAKVHVRRPPESLWQLAADFRADMTVHRKDGGSYRLRLKAPRGLMTDLASVPKVLWSLVGPIGPHLEASILHDYLYMAWTDYRSQASRSDWDFADRMFLEGMRTSHVSRRRMIYGVVHSDIGWDVFRRKSYTLKDRMDDWLPLLASGHRRDD